jgi:hypothetical protein
MSTHVAEYTTHKQHSSLRTYGILPILASILQFIAGIGIENRSGEYSPKWATALFLAGSICLIAVPLGVRAAGAYKNSRLGKMAVILTLLGFVGWIVGTIFILTNPSQEWDQPFTPIGAMFSSLGMILLGISVIRAKVWHGWRRFALIFVPGYYFLVVLPLQFLVFIPRTDDVNFYLLGTWYLTWSLVGMALLTARE